MCSDLCCYNLYVLNFIMSSQKFQYNMLTNKLYKPLL